MKVLIKFGDFGQHTIVVPITTLGIVNGELVRGFGYTSKGANRETRGYICGQKLKNAQIVQYLS